MRLREAVSLAIEFTHTAAAVIVFVCLCGLGLIVVGVVVALAAMLSWTAGSLISDSATYSTILQDPEATATLVGVVIAGFFGFGGIILTNVLSARAARAQTETNERLAREERSRNEQMARQLQLEIAKGMDRRISEFADAFAKYHAETLKALRRDPPP